MRLDRKRVLVTGAGGFIGSHLVETLCRANCLRVRAFVHYNSRNMWGNIEDLPAPVKKEIEVVPGDLQDPLSIKRAVADMEVVFHLGALVSIPYSYAAPRSFLDTNVLGTLNVFQACLEHGVERVVHTSTSEVYGTALYVPIDEKHPLQAQSPYAASKIAADKLAESFHRSFDLPVCTVRPFNAFGPRQSARAVIPTILTQILGTRERKIRLGSLHPVRDMTYVEDTAAGFVRAAESDGVLGEVINLGTGKGLSIQETAEKIIALTGREVEITADPVRVRPDRSEVGCLVCENRKARELLGWEPRVSLEEGLERTMAYIEKNLDRYKSEVYNI